MISLESFLPQGEEVACTIREARTGQLVHAMIITGGPGLGKWTLAESLAAALLCRAESGKPCGQCASCRQMISRTHPDLISVQKGSPLTPTDTKHSIPLSDIQETVRLISQHGFEGDRHVVTIRHAEDMTTQAQNALLKTLEEPPAGVWFLLTSRNMDQLLSTIISRCRQIRLHPWENETVKRMLMDHGIKEDRAEQAAGVSGGSFGEALRIAEDDSFWHFRDEVVQDFLCCERRSDILKISSRWKDRKDDAEDLFSVLDSFLNQLMHFALGLSEFKDVSGIIPEKWIGLSERADLEWFVSLADAVALARKRSEANVNFQAAAEQLILAFMEASEK